MKRVAMIALLGLLLAASGCSTGATRLEPGDSYTTQSGIGFTVPSGASGTVTHPAPAEMQQDVPYTELVDLQLDEEHSVAFLSFAKEGRNSLDATVVAGSPEGAVVVRDSGNRTLRAVIETQIRGSAPGRVIVMVRRDSKEARRGLELSRWAWRELAIEGPALPDQ